MVEAHSRHRIVQAHSERAQLESFTHGVTRRITLSISEHIQVQRHIWFLAKVFHDNGSAKGPSVQDSAVNAAILLASSGMSLCSSFYLLESFSFPDPAQWNSSIRVVYVVIPFFTGLAGVSAFCLHAQRSRTAFDPGDVILEAFRSTSRLLYTIIPASVLAGWVIGSAQSTMLFTLFQIVVLGVGVLLPTYLFQNGSDDW